jgi:heme-degrading monooxygenase HmoA
MEVFDLLTPHPSNVGPIALVDVFDLDIENRDLFLQTWSDRAAFMREQPGFVSLLVLQAVSAAARFQVIAVTTWENLAAVHAATVHDGFIQTARRAVDELGVIAHPGLYRTALRVADSEATRERRV